jgi:hypothetical protein
VALFHWALQVKFVYKSGMEVVQECKVTLVFSCLMLGSYVAKETVTWHKRAQTFIVANIGQNFINLWMG